MILTFKRTSSLKSFSGHPVSVEEEIVIPGAYPGIVKRWILCYLLGCKITNAADFYEVENEAGFDYLCKFNKN